MDKKILGLIAAVSSLGAAGAAQADTPPASSVMDARSFAELLDPIPDAASVLSAVDQEPNARPVQLAQWHHHHHRWWRRHRHHHHHHHHHHHNFL
ncbi:MAG: hypothetical protein ABSG83_12050 [Roseiarcus sp.]|jgi:hypothetical protein